MHENYLDSIKKLFRYYKDLGEKAIDQLNDQQIRWRQDEHSNNISTIVKHMTGNMLSRWTDFLTSDGEKMWRKRDEEFLDTLQDKKDLLKYWEKGWACLIAAIDPLTPDDLEKIVYIRNEGHTVAEAINRQLAHYAYHVGQIVYIAKSLKSEKWISLSIQKGKSKDFNKEKFDREKRRKHFI